ncbi:hypothetical protein GQ457_13G017360 [Hibiscus cannabinus]
MNYFTQQLGGFHNVGFIRRDVYNSLQTSTSVEIVDGVVNALLAYCDCKKEIDMVNTYGQSLMPIVGVNHHHQTIVFVVAIIARENACIYEWVLKTFLEVMFNKSPVSVVTDGDKAMHRWRPVVQQFNFEHNPWVVEKDRTTHFWAQAYLTSHFFANVQSTQRWSL